VDALKDELLQPLHRRDGVSPAEVRRRIQAIAGTYVGILRNGLDLGRAVKALEAIRVTDLPRMAVISQDRGYNKEWIDALEVRNLLLCLEASARSAFLRTESRGLHYRVDCVEMDNDQWLKEIVVKESEGAMRLSTKPVTVTQMKLPTGRMTWEAYLMKTVPLLHELEVWTVG